MKRFSIRKSNVENLEVPKEEEEKNPLLGMLGLESNSQLQSRLESAISQQRISSINGS